MRRSGLCRQRQSPLIARTSSAPPFPFRHGPGRTGTGHGGERRVIPGCRPGTSGHVLGGPTAGPRPGFPADEGRRGDGGDGTSTTRRRPSLRDRRTDGEAGESRGRAAEASRRAGATAGGSCRPCPAGRGPGRVTACGGAVRADRTDDGPMGAARDGDGPARRNGPHRVARDAHRRRATRPRDGHRVRAAWTRRNDGRRRARARRRPGRAAAAGAVRRPFPGAGLRPAPGAGRSRDRTAALPPDGRGGSVTAVLLLVAVRVLMGRRGRTGSGGRAHGLVADGVPRRARLLRLLRAGVPARHAGLLRDGARRRHLLQGSGLQRGGLQGSGLQRRGLRRDRLRRDRLRRLRVAAVGGLGRGRRKRGQRRGERGQLAAAARAQVAARVVRRGDPDRSDLRGAPLGHERVVDRSVREGGGGVVAASIRGAGGGHGHKLSPPRAGWGDR
ncbi:hypothetical protein STXM2123_849 [Streptomyces sp. F-3]|nr:hypothetical protein STXM2123_849 [Streptomyces sp. F-3]